MNCDVGTHTLNAMMLPAKVANSLRMAGLPSDTSYVSHEKKGIASASSQTFHDTSPFSSSWKIVLETTSTV